MNTLFKELEFHESNVDRIYEESKIKTTHKAKIKEGKIAIRQNHKRIIEINKMLEKYGRNDGGDINEAGVVKIKNFDALNETGDFTKFNYIVDLEYDKSLVDAKYKDAIISNDYLKHRSAVTQKNIKYKKRL
jgi:hypothetical protein